MEKAIEILRSSLQYIDSQLVDAGDAVKEREDAIFRLRRKIDELTVQRVEVALALTRLEKSE
jgi:prefoldin subunit 5